MINRKLKNSVALSVILKWSRDMVSIAKKTPQNRRIFMV